MKFPVRVDSHIRIEGLSSSWEEWFKNACSVPNEARDRAIKEHVWGANKLPAYISLMKYNGGEVTLPRGFRDELEIIVFNAGHDLEVDDRTVLAQYDYPNLTHIGKAPKLDDEQFDAFTALLRNDQGRIIMPPGKGKTVLSLAAIRSFYAKTLIIVQQKHIAQQWVDRAKEHFDLDIGFIGDGKWEEKDITVALVQTLWSRRDIMDKHHFEDDYDTVGINSWWEKWGAVILDEQHHIPADTVSDIIQRFPAKRRYGISATVGKTDADKRVSELIFGPILYESKEVNVKPYIQVVDTDFDFAYKPTKKYIKPNGKQGIQRNNYTKLIKALVEDENRNETIADKICDDLECCHLIVSDRLKQLDILEGKVASYIMTHRLTGKESLDKRMGVYEKANNGQCAIFSTVASEALDIPRIDRIHLVYPRRNIEAVWQIIGRGTREHPDKKNCIVIDYRDKCSVLRNQFNGRVRELYRPKNLTVQLPQNSFIA